MIDTDGSHVRATRCKFPGCKGKPILNGGCKLHWRDDGERAKPPVMIRLAVQDQRFMMDALRRKG